MLRHLRALAALIALVALFPPAHVAQSLPPAQPDAVGVAGDRLARVRPLLQDRVDRGEVAGAVALIARDGRVVLLESVGSADVAGRRAMRPDTIFRIASMTKPVTSVAVMMLVEEGKLLLSDPVSKYIPELKDLKVIAGTREGQTAAEEAPAAGRQVTIRDLLTHRAGLTYQFMPGPVAKAYLEASVSNGLDASPVTSAENVRRIAALPLVHQPGQSFHYSMATDVLGRVVEVVSGQSLDLFYRDRIFRPLQMEDTFFTVPAEKVGRVATVYTPDGAGGLRVMKDPERFGDLEMSPGRILPGSKGYPSGGAGLASTAGDYARFLQMLLNGGELDGVRLLGPKTVELMTVSHTADLPAGGLGRGQHFGLGFAVLEDLGASGIHGSVGTYEWGGIYGTAFWVDPKERLIGILMTQLYPNSQVTIDETFRTAAYQAITGPPR